MNRDKAIEFITDFCKQECETCKFYRDWTNECTIVNQQVYIHLDNKEIEAKDIKDEMSKKSDEYLMDTIEYVCKESKCIGCYELCGSTLEPVCGISGKHPKLTFYEDLKKYMED